MDRLGKLRKGQKVKAVTRKGTIVYRTTKVVTWTKEEPPSGRSACSARSARTCAWC